MGHLGRISDALDAARWLTGGKDIEIAMGETLFAAVESEATIGPRPEAGVEPWELFGCPVVIDNNLPVGGFRFRESKPRPALLCPLLTRSCVGDKCMMWERGRCAIPVRRR